ncbi:hypothetical protein IWQ60_003214 [Tieghemiomyces parasiticus]|uniref:Uncharacterized protein n=1 Tax=Tieghemiomyces parasiticus TaxID=78921 RepID=A0A9W8AD97_9FUNG|nr:hypothetical protein IWQ60_003214 [Tieghemiomyces parasiticus]
MTSAEPSADYKYVAINTGDEKVSLSDSPPAYHPDAAASAPQCRRKVRAKKFLAASLITLLLVGTTVYYGRRSGHCGGLNPFKGHPHHGNHYPVDHFLNEGEEHNGVQASWLETHRAIQMEHCEANVPYEGQTEFEFDPTEYEHFAGLVHGAAFSHVKIQVDENDATPAADARIKVKANVNVSDEKLLRGVKVVADKREGGHHKHPGHQFALNVHSPLFLRRGDCVRADIVLTLPKSVKQYQSIIVKYLAGHIAADEAFGELPLHFFRVGNVAGDLAFDKLKAGVVVLTSAKGSIGGHFDVAHAAVFRTVSGNVAAKINAAHPDSTVVRAKTVSGNVKVVINEDYEGPFELATISGKTGVAGQDLKFDHDRPGLKTGYHGEHPPKDGDDDHHHHDHPKYELPKPGNSDIVKALPVSMDGFLHQLQEAMLHMKTHLKMLTHPQKPAKGNHFPGGDARPFLRPYVHSKRSHAKEGNDDGDHKPHHPHSKIELKSISGNLALNFV